MRAPGAAGRGALLAAAAVAVVVVVGAVAAATRQTGTLAGTVGPGFAISLTKPDGAGVTSLDPGEYSVAVSDRADLHNFHLLGPGVDQRTGVEAVEDVTWQVALANGEYRFLCDVHPDQMRGTFTVGPPPTPPAPPTEPPAAKPKPPVLLASVGPGATIAVANAAGRRLAAVRAGLYDVRVSDRSVRDNFHLVGPGVNRKTGLAARGSATWRVRLAKGRTYAYRSDRAASRLAGTLRAV
jgi:hypothetical protein